jgi:hypothetical protein
LFAYHLDTETLTIEGVADRIAALSKIQLVPNNKIGLIRYIILLQQNNN